MNARLLLAGAICSEVAGTMALRAAVDHPGWYALVVAGYLASFTLMGLTLRAGMAIGAVYGIWGATGVALTAALGAAIFSEHLSAVMIGGIGLIIVGVVLIETGSKAGASGKPPGGSTRPGDSPPDNNPPDASPLGETPGGKARCAAGSPGESPRPRALHCDMPCEHPSASHEEATR